MDGFTGEIIQVEGGASFRFACHPGVGCFTDCCRQLDLALWPVDVLFLKLALGLRSDQFLDRYAVIEKEEAQPFPQVYLGMVDDGRGSCPFVAPTGCQVYGARPAACRMYPLGRGTRLAQDGSKEECYIQLREAHCRGFQEPASHTVEQWLANQGLLLYNQLNDEVMAIVQHERVQQGFRPDGEQQRLALLALYDLDSFREQVAAPALGAAGLTATRRIRLTAAAEIDNLRLAMRWLAGKLYDDNFDEELFWRSSGVKA